MKEKLTQRFVNSLGPVDRETWFWDPLQKGLFIRARPGVPAVWGVRYHVKGKAKTAVIGPVGEWKADSAKDRAHEVRRNAKLGVDVFAEARAKIHEPTIADLSREHLDIQKPPKISAAYYRDKKTHWREYIIPAIGSIKVADLSKADVEKLHSKFKKQPALANAILATLSKALTDCLEFKPPWRSDNPCSRVSKFEVKKRQRILSQSELQTVMTRLEAMKLEASPTWSIPWLIQLLLMTGLRLRELANRRWSEVNLETGVLTIPKPKGRKEDRHVSLSSEAIEILKAMPRRGPWIFPNSNGDGPFASPQKHWMTIRSELKLDDVRVHDIRHTVASYAHHVGGVSQRQLMELLGHSQMSTTERYLNVHDEMKKDISDRAASAISSLSSLSPENQSPQPS